MRRFEEKVKKLRSERPNIQMDDSQITLKNRNLTHKLLLCKKNPITVKVWAFLGGSAIKNPPANSGDSGSIPGSGRSPGEGNGNSLQYSCLGNSMDRVAGGL